MVFVREDQEYPDIKVRHALRAASWCYSNWGAEVAGRLVADFRLPPGRAVKKLSRGMRSAMGIVIGLAARAEVTLFDEPYAGLDAPARQLFYDSLLADYAEHPRTVLLSTHLIDEAAGLLEQVVVMDQGRVVLDAPIDELRGAATTVAGPVLAVNDFTAGRTLWERREAGSQASVVMAGPLDEADRARARSLRLNLAPLLHFFRVPYILDGPWYLTWLTSFVGLSLLFGYGTWLGLVQRRWGLAGSLSFLAAQVTVVVAVALLVTVAHAWAQTGPFFTTLSAARLTGLLAILAAVLLAGGYATVRRVVI